MAGKLKWRGAELERRLKKATADGIVRAGTFYHSKCREAVSKPNTGVRRRYKDQSNESKSERESKGRNKTSYTIYPNPSRPGEPPRLRTGFGQRNIVVNHDRQKITTRVGVTKNGIYMIFLELGTQRVARRPWLVKTLRDNQRIIGRLATSRKVK